MNNGLTRHLPKTEELFGNNYINSMLRHNYDIPVIRISNAEQEIRDMMMISGDFNSHVIFSLRYNKSPKPGYADYTFHTFHVIGMIESTDDLKIYNYLRFKDHIEYQVYEVNDIHISDHPLEWICNVDKTYTEFLGFMSKDGSTIVIYDCILFCDVEFSKRVEYSTRYMKCMQLCKLIEASNILKSSPKLISPRFIHRYPFPLVDNDIYLVKPNFVRIYRTYPEDILMKSKDII